MALRCGIAGPPNSGKSFARRKKTADDVVVLSPSRKALHMKMKDGSAPKPLEITTPKFKSFAAVGEAIGMRGAMSHEILYMLLNTPQYAENFHTGEYKLSGHHMVIKDMSHVQSIEAAVSQFMPHIKVIICPDFTHFITEVISKKSFIEQKAGGQAFQRFWELAGNIARNLLLSSDYLREDMIVVTEFHTEYDDNRGEFYIFTPAGKMVAEKFLPDSYFDYMFYTDPLKDEETGKVIDWRYVTEKVGAFNGRSGGIFNDTYIPNDLNLVLSKIREYEGI